MSAFIQAPGEAPTFPDAFITVTLTQENVDSRAVFGTGAIEHFDLTHPATVPGEAPVPLGLNVYGGGGADLFILPADGKADSIKDYDTDEDCLDLSDWGVTDFSDLTLIEHKSGKLIVTFEDQAVALGSWSAPVAAADFTADQIIVAEPVQGRRDLSNDDAVNGWLVGSDEAELYFLSSANLKIFSGGGADSLIILPGNSPVNRILDFDPAEDQLILNWDGARDTDDLEIIRLANGKVVVKDILNPTSLEDRNTVILGSADHPIDPDADVRAAIGHIEIT